MWIKKYIAVFSLVPFLVCGAEGGKENQNDNRKKAPEKQQMHPEVSVKAVPLTKKEKQALLKELSMAASRFDPRQPGLTAAHVQKVLLKDIYDGLLDKKIPDEPGSVKKSGDTITYLGTRMALFKYEILLKNPELSEVTAITPAWYKSYGEKLKKMEELAKKLDQASANGDPAAYRQAKNAIEAYQKVLKDFAGGKKPKLSSDGLRLLRRQNIKWRIAEFKKQQAERLKKAGLTSENLKEAASAEPEQKRSTVKKSVKTAEKKRNSSASGKNRNTRRRNTSRRNW
ncbi:MAG: hypothetical protein IKA79_09720 [Lentisphaeria bacterium]|nr:hypothetical protein [Lentisphaeria bacterium]